MSRDLEVERHERRIKAVLARKAERLGYSPGQVVETHTPLDALLQSEDGDNEEDRARSEIIGRLIDFVLQDGLHPGRAMKNFYAVVHALRPQALPGDWSCKDFGELFGETKAAHSWRVKQLFGKRLVVAGKRAIKARFQKASGSTANYAAAQKGNTNRRHGIPRPAK